MGKFQEYWLTDVEYMLFNPYNFELKPVIAAAFMRIANCPVRRMRFELTLL